MVLNFSDKSLVRQALNGKQEAWEDLIRRHEKKVFNFSLRMTSNREDALDLMQDIFLSVYRNLGSFNHKAAFSTWLYTIASRRSVDFYRRKKPLESLSDENELVSDLQFSETPLGRVQLRQSNRQLMTILKRLTQEQRLVVEMKLFQDQTFEEMSRHLGISTNTLKSRFYGALKKMKTMPEVAHAL